MKYFEFGNENEELMVLLHGGGTSYLGVLEDMGHGSLVGENTERFIQEVDKAHKHTGD